MSPEACVTQRTNYPKNRRPPKAALELRAKVRELYLAGKTDPNEIESATGRCRATIITQLKTLDKDPDSGVTFKQKPNPKGEDSKWYNIIERVAEELPFYKAQGLVPSVRKMYYRLIELKDLEKTKTNYDKLTRFTAEARRGIDSTYTNTGRFPKLPIDCFKDENRFTIGDTDIDDEPTDPTPAEPPEDPIKYIDGKIEGITDSIRELKNNIILLRDDAADDYNGECEPGSEGVDPGYWYNQPTYCEVWCESETIQPDLEKYQGDKKVRVASSRGFSSTPYMYRECLRLATIAENHDHIENIVILYFGDSDKAGKKIAKNIESSLDWYQSGDSEDLTISVEVEFRQVAITPEQVREYNLTGYQLEAFMTTDERLKIFKKILQEAIDDCWDEDVYLENCPDEEYDYEAAGEEEPEDIDIDEEGYDDDTEDTFRDIMQRKIDEALENDFKKYVDENNV